MSKLPFHARGEVWRRGAALAAYLHLDDEAAERLVSAMLGALGHDAPMAAAGASCWPAAGGIETLGPHHGLVLLGDATRRRVGYRDVNMMVRVADNGQEAPWATCWWPLP